MTSVGTLALTGCANVTGLIDAHDNFGCPAADGINCSTLTQTFERESAKDLSQEKLRVVSQRGSFVNEESSASNPVQNKTLENEKTTLRAASGEVKSANAEIVETTTVRRYPVGLEPKNESRFDVKPRKVNEGVAALKKQTFRTSSGKLDRARKGERVVMLWVLPWVDDAGDLHEASRIWMRIEDALWRIESVRTRAFDAGVSGAVP